MNNDTFKRIQVRAQALLQNTSTSTTNANDLLPKVKEWANYRYDRILRSFPWNEIVRSYNQSIVASTRDYALDRQVESIIKMWDTTNGKEITAMDLRDHIRFVAPVLEVAGNVQTGVPDQYIDIGSKSVKLLLTQATKVQVVSTSASDITPKIIRIVGPVSGVEVAEDIILTGATGADSTNTYDSGSELTISAGTNNGTLSDLAGVVSIKETATLTNILAVLAPEERSPLYRWVRLSATPASNATYQIWYKKKWRKLVNDTDIPIIPCANEIVEGIVADALMEDGQTTEFQLQDARFEKLVAELWSSQKPRNLIKMMTPDNPDSRNTGGRQFLSYDDL